MTTDFDRLYKSIRPVAYIFSEAQTHKVEKKPIQVGRSGRNFTGDIGAFQGSMDNLKVFERYLTQNEFEFDIRETRSPSDAERWARSARAEGYDLLVVVRGNNLLSVATFVSEKLATLGAVQSTATRFMLRCYKVDGILLGADFEDPDKPAISP